MIRKHKKYSWPRKLYDKTRITDENKLVERYGLKNKREIWKAEAEVRYLRTKAKKLITATQEAQHAFFKNLNKIGLKVSSVADALALTKEDILKRRLTMMVLQAKVANTPQQARQMISHKRILVDGKVVSSPSYLVKVSEEHAITVRKSTKPAKKEEVVAEVAA